MSAAAASSISAVILTRNEAIHIRRCLRSAKRICDVVYVIDSNSSDRTRSIAEQEGAVVRTGDFPSFAEKLNAANDTIDFATA